MRVCCAVVCLHKAPEVIIKDTTIQNSNNSIPRAKGKKKCNGEKTITMFIIKEPYVVEEKTFSSASLSRRSTCRRDSLNVKVLY